MEFEMLNGCGRFDGRSGSLQLRPVSIERNVVGRHSGSVRFRQGHSEVVAAVKGPVETSFADKNKAEKVALEDSAQNGGVVLVVLPRSGGTSVCDFSGVYQTEEDDVTDIADGISGREEDHEERGNRDTNTVAQNCVGFDRDADRHYVFTPAYEKAKTSTHYVPGNNRPTKSSLRESYIQMVLEKPLANIIDFAQIPNTTTYISIQICGWDGAMLSVCWNAIILALLDSGIPLTNMGRSTSATVPIALSVSLVHGEYHKLGPINRTNLSKKNSENVNDTAKLDQRIKEITENIAQNQNSLKTAAQTQNSLQASLLLLDPTETEASIANANYCLIVYTNSGSLLAAFPECLANASTSSSDKTREAVYASSEAEWETYENSKGRLLLSEQVPLLLQHRIVDRLVKAGKGHFTFWGDEETNTNTQEDQSPTKHHMQENKLKLPNMPLLSKLIHIAHVGARCTEAFIYRPWFEAELKLNVVNTIQQNIF